MAAFVVVVVVVGAAAAVAPVPAVQVLVFICCFILVLCIITQEVMKYIGWVWIDNDYQIDSINSRTRNLSSSHKLSLVSYPIFITLFTLLDVVMPHIAAYRFVRIRFNSNGNVRNATNTTNTLNGLEAFDALNESDGRIASERSGTLISPRSDHSSSPRPPARTGPDHSLTLPQGIDAKNPNNPNNANHPNNSNNANNNPNNANNAYNANYAAVPQIMLLQIGLERFNTKNDGILLLISVSCALIFQIFWVAEWQIMNNENDCNTSTRIDTNDQADAYQNIEFEYLYIGVMTYNISALFYFILLYFKLRQQRKPNFAHVQSPQ